MYSSHKFSSFLVFTEGFFRQYNYDIYLSQQDKKSHFVISLWSPLVGRNEMTIICGISEKIGLFLGLHDYKFEKVYIIILKKYI